MVIALGWRCAAFALCLIAAVTGAHAAQRTSVSTAGSDANACTLAAPCRAFAKALTVTDDAGEIVVLDSGGYGGVVVNKNVSILSPAGVYAGISVFAATDGIVIAAPATKVVLRGLAINGQGGNNGVSVQAGEVHVEASAISNLTQAGILVEGGIGLLQSNSGLLNACGRNLLIANTTAQSGAINTSPCLDVAAGAGTVTSVATGAGLGGGPITTSGTVNLASTQLLPTVACAPTQIPKPELTYAHRARC